MRITGMSNVPWCSRQFRKQVDRKSLKLVHAVQLPGMSQKELEDLKTSLLTRPGEDRQEY
jgi:hypothetical protein